MPKSVRPPQAPKRSTRPPALLAASAKPSAKRHKLPVLHTPRKDVHCLSCALCCSYVGVEIDAPDTVRGATEILWYMYHDGVSVYVEDGDFMLQFETTCRYLQPDNRCGIYEHRPLICRDFDEKTCEVNAEEVGTSLYTVDDFMAYLKEHHKRIHALVRKRFFPPEGHAVVARTKAPALPVSAVRLAALRARSLGATPGGKRGARPSQRPVAAADVS